MSIQEWIQELARWVDDKGGEVDLSSLSEFYSINPDAKAAIRGTGSESKLSKNLAKYGAAAGLTIKKRWKTHWLCRDPPQASPPPFPPPSPPKGKPKPMREWALSPPEAFKLLRQWVEKKKSLSHGKEWEVPVQQLVDFFEATPGAKAAIIGVGKVSELEKRVADHGGEVGLELVGVHPNQFLRLKNVVIPKSAPGATQASPKAEASDPQAVDVPATEAGSGTISQPDAIKLLREWIQEKHNGSIDTIFLRDFYAAHPEADTALRSQGAQIRHSIQKFGSEVGLKMTKTKITCVPPKSHLEEEAAAGRPKVEVEVAEVEARRTERGAPNAGTASLLTGLTRTTAVDVEDTRVDSTKLTSTEAAPPASHLASASKDATRQGVSSDTLVAPIDALEMLTSIVRSGVLTESQIDSLCKANPMANLLRNDNQEFQVAASTGDHGPAVGVHNGAVRSVPPTAMSGRGSAKRATAEAEVVEAAAERVKIDARKTSTFGDARQPVSTNGTPRKSASSLGEATPKTGSTKSTQHSASHRASAPRNPARPAAMTTVEALKLLREWVEKQGGVVDRKQLAPFYEAHPQVRAVLKGKIAKTITEHGQAIGIEVNAEIISSVNLEYTAVKLLRKWVQKQGGFILLGQLGVFYISHPIMGAVLRGEAKKSHAMRHITTFSKQVGLKITKDRITCVPPAPRSGGTSSNPVVGPDRVNINSTPPKVPNTGGGTAQCAADAATRAGRATSTTTTPTHTPVRAPRAVVAAASPTTDWFDPNDEFVFLEDPLAAHCAMKHVLELVGEQRRGGMPPTVAVDLEGELTATGRISLLQLKIAGLPPLVFDLLATPRSMALDSSLGTLLADSSVCKVIHDCRNDAVALFGQLGIQLACVYDTKIAYMKGVDNSTQPGLNVILERFSTGQNELKAQVAHTHGEWSQRPLPHHNLSYAAQDVEHLCEACSNMCALPFMDRAAIVHLTELSVLEKVKAKVRRGPIDRPDLGEYALLSAREQLARTAAAYYDTHLRDDQQLREVCQDIARCKADFEGWKAGVEVPGNPAGTRYRGSFAAVQKELRSTAVLLSARRSEPTVLRWAVDTPQNQRGASSRPDRTASEIVQRNRHLFEKDRGGIVVGQLANPDVVPCNRPIPLPLSVTNGSATKRRMLQSVKFLVAQATNREGAFRVDERQMEFPCPIPPGSTVIVPIICTPTIGVNREILELQFDGFAIGRFPEVRAGDSALHELLKPTTPYRKTPKGTRIKRSPFEPTANPPPVGGVKPWLRNCDEHEVPEEFTKMLELGEVEERLEAEHNQLVLAADGQPDELSTVYPAFYHKLGWIEEEQALNDLAEFSMEGVFLDHEVNEKYWIKVEGLAEGRPSVMVGDKVAVRFQPGSRPRSGGMRSMKRWRGAVRKVEKDRILAEFDPRFKYNGQPVDVEFELNRTLLKLGHAGLDSIVEIGCNILFPDIASQPHHPPRYPPANLVRTAEGANLNAEQWAAVTHVLEGVSRPLPYIIFGPPGTGKTSTVVELIAQAVATIHPRCRVLACAPSNTAADVLCRGLARHLDPSELLRVVAPSRRKTDVDRTLHKYCIPQDGDYFAVPVDKEDIVSKRVVVTTMAMASKLPYLLDLPRGFFDLIVVDEAGQATEIDTAAVVGPLLDPKVGQVVLAGDPQQLGPVIQSKLAARYGLDVSMLERLTRRTVYRKRPPAVPTHGANGGEDDEEEVMYDPRVLTKLVRNYRSHEIILSLPSELFYDGELRAEADPVTRSQLAQWPGLPTLGAPLIFHGVKGKDEREGTSPSWFNRSEIEVVRGYVEQLLTSEPRVQPEDIGIISPYSKQVQKLKIMLKNQGLSRIMVGSTEQFQGQEKRVIILSTVRSSEEWLAFDAKHSLGFLTNSKRFNVAITRAMQLLIVVGDPTVLNGCPNWRALMKYCCAIGACRGEPPPNGTGDDGPNDGSDNGTAAMVALKKSFHSMSFNTFTNGSTPLDVSTTAPAPR